MKTPTLKKTTFAGKPHSPLYGFSHFDFMRDENVFLLIPLNLIVRYGRDLWYRLGRPPATWTGKAMHKIYFKGKEEGAKRLAGAIWTVRDDPRLVEQILSHELFPDDKRNDNDNPSTD